LARLASLVVDDTCRSQGIGEQLLHASESWARAQHCDVLELSSNIKRVDAHRFYERLGYNKTGWRLWKALS
jgi:GNAT superfamily N-acetyltransferase